MWSDTDPAGIVWFGVFFRYFENAEEELFRRLGRDRTPLLHELGIFMPRTSLQAQFRSPAKLGDEILVGVGVGEITDRRVGYTFDIREQRSGRLICEASYRVACVDANTFTARAFPYEITDLLSRAMLPGPRAGAQAERSREVGTRRPSRRPALKPPRQDHSAEASRSVDSGARRRRK
jgi:YbgC/YbaW family acyl-CoA thioester hydrolase